ncbi:MAG TPA: hypothetical protein DDZ29_00245, partial [Alteromonas mediterranea]|nr:hypothetical protein [Alteromonas mediterranea]
MLITITTPNLSSADKQLLIATLKLAPYACVVFVGDGVYAPALNTAFFEQLANTVKDTVTDTV